MGLFSEIGSIASSIGTKATALDAVLQQQQISASVLAQLQPLLGQLNDSNRPLSAIFGDVSKMVAGPSVAGSVDPMLKALKVMKLMTDIAAVKARLQQLQEDLDDALDETRQPTKSTQEAITRMMNDLMQPDPGDQEVARNALQRQKQMVDLLSKMVQGQSDAQKSILQNMR